jgi:trimeric autotransporter adhesin
MRTRCESLALRVHRSWAGLRAIVVVAALVACGGSTDSVSPGGGGNGGVQIAITPSAPSITVGGQVTLQAEVRGSNGQLIPGAAVFWSSADTSIVSVSSAGVVTGKSIGNTQIAASSSGASTVTTVTVVQVPVASVAVLPSAATLVTGGTVTLQTVAYDANSNPLSGRAIVWASSASQVATVDASGKVTAVSAGSATVSGTVEGKSASSAITVTVIPVAAVAVTPGSATLDVGASKALDAVATDANGNTLAGRPITWASANKSIATVSASGLVTGVGAGTTDITATAEGKTGTAQVVVTATTPPPPIPVASVAVNPGTASLNIGGSVTLSATARDANGAALSGRAITWSTSAAAIATVSSTGVVNAIAPGSATVTATSEGKSGSATIIVLPAAPPSVASVTVTSNGATTIDSAQTVTLTATVRDSAGNRLSGRTVNWSSNASAATVSPASGTTNTLGAVNGVVTGVSPGNASILAKSDTATFVVGVTVLRVPVETVTVTPTSATVQVGDTTRLTATTKDSAGNVLRNRAVTWSSSAPTIASVDANGLVRGVAAGRATITGASEGKNGTSAITVNPIPVATVTISPSSPSVVQHLTTTLTATTKDANGNTLTGRTVTWSVTPTSVATIDPTTGVVTGVSAGSATVTAMSETKTGTATLTVTPAPVATVTVAPPSGPLVVGQTVTLSDTVKDAHGFVLTGRVVTWSSSNTSKATVDQNTGLVTGVDSGSTTITATSEGKFGTATVTVDLVPVASVTVTAATTPIELGQTTTVTAVAKDINGNVLSGRHIAWSSADTAVATVDSNGTVTPVAPGSVSIIATIDGTSGSTIITVTH